MADWLREEIGTGLQKLLVLRLPGTPPEDSIVGTAEIWLEALQNRNTRWEEHLDRDRVRLAFRKLFGICDRWPTPRMLIDHLGSRAPPRAMPPPRRSPEEIARNKARIEELRQSLLNAKRM